MDESSDPARELASIDRLAGEAARWLDDAPAARGTVNDAVSRWSPRVHLDHAARATSSAFRMVDRILANDPRCVAPGAPSPALAAILTAAAIPRGRADAPDAMKPPPDVSHETTVEDLRACGAAAQALAARANSIREAVLRLPHFALGPMTATEWVRFARVHFEHHLRIAREVTAGR